MSKDIKTAKGIEDACNSLLRNRSFAYKDSTSTDPDKAFRSTLVIQLLAHAHLRACSGSVDVSALQLSVKEYSARGAIALCLSAVSCFTIIVFSDTDAHSWSVPSRSGRCHRTFLIPTGVLQVYSRGLASKKSRVKKILLQNFLPSPNSSGEQWHQATSNRFQGGPLKLFRILWHSPRLSFKRIVTAIPVVMTRVKVLRVRPTCVHLCVSCRYHSSAILIHLW